MKPSFSAITRTIIPYLIALVSLLPGYRVSATPLPDNGRCQIVVGVKGENTALFERQVQQLSHHFERGDIALFDLNNTRLKKPFTNLSGRKRRQIKEALNLNENKSIALVFYESTMRYQGNGNLDLTLLIQLCRKQLESAS